MSRDKPRRMALRKALQGITSVKCYEPDKISYPSLRRARLAARAQGLREYQCGDHYHLTSRPNYRVP